MLKNAARSATEHMHNHVETTLKNSASYYSLALYDGSPHTYTVSFRAKWLHARLWHNRLAEPHDGQHALRERERRRLDQRRGNPPVRQRGAARCDLGG